jgi:surfeit locus 1 family protein
MAEGSGRFPWLLTIACAGAFVLLCGLGSWQVQRMQWKERLIASAESRLGQPARILPDWPSAPPPGQAAPAPPPPPPALRDFERVVVRCTWVSRQPTVRLRSIHEGVAGERVIKACGGYLVDLGFVSDEALASAVPLPHDTPSRSWDVTVTAEARQTPPPSPFSPPPEDHLFYARDNEAIAKALQHHAYDRPVLFAEKVEGGIWYPARPVPAPPPAAFSNNHLGYALTWFGLALAVVGFYIALLRRKPDGSPAETKDAP